MFINFILMGQATSRVGYAGDAAVGRASAGDGHSRIKAGAAYALSSPSATRCSEGRQAQPAPNAIAIIAASNRDDGGSGADVETPDKGTGSNGAAVNAASSSSPTASSSLPRSTEGRTSTSAVDFPAGTQASGRVPADVWNSRQINENDAIRTATTSSPSTAGDDDADATQADDRTVTVIATSDRGDSGSGADIEEPNAENGSGGARANTTPTPSPTTSSVLPCRAHNRMSTCAVEFPAGNQALGRVPARVWNSRQADETTNIVASTKSPPSAAGDDDAYVTQVDDCVDIRVYDGQGAPQPPPAAQP